MIVRVLRALSGKTQEQISEELEVDASLIAQFELGKVLPSPDHLEKLAKGVGISVSNVEILLGLFEVFRDPRLRRGQTFLETVAGLEEATAALAETSYLLMLGTPMPGGPPGPEEHRQADYFFLELEQLSQEERLAVVQSVDACQTWALLERVCQEVDQEAHRNVEIAAAWVEVAQEIAVSIQGPEEWRKCVRQYAREYAARVPGCLPS